MVIENFEIIFGELVCLAVCVVARNTFSERAEGDVKVPDVFSDRFPTITLCNIAMDRIARRYSL